MKIASSRRTHSLIALGATSLAIALLSAGCASTADAEDISTTREADLVLRDAQADTQPVDAAPDPCNMTGVAGAIAWICCDVSGSWHDAVYCMANDCSRLCGDNPPTDALVGCYPDPETHDNDCFRACTHDAQADIDRSAAAGTCGTKRILTSDAATATPIAESSDPL